MCETRLLTVAEIDSWLAGARAGDALVYCTGPILPPGPTSTRSRKLRDTGRVHLRQRRAEGCVGTEYVMVKAEPSPVSAPGSRSGAGAAGTPAGDPATEAIFAALERCVERRREAYSDAELARIAGLATRHQARHRLAALAEAKRLRLERVETRDGPRRVVWIGARSTRRPAGESGC